MNWQVVTIIIIILVCIATVGIYLLIHKRDVPTSEEDWWIEIHSDGKKTNIPLSEFKDLPSVEAKIALEGIGEDGKKHTYEGVSLAYILERWGTNDTKDIRVEAVDYYNYKLDAKDVRGEDSIMLAYLCDGRSLGTKGDGGVGAVRLIIPQSVVGHYNAQHCVKFVYRVDLE